MVMMIMVIRVIILLLYGVLNNGTACHIRPLLSTPVQLIFKRYTDLDLTSNKCYYDPSTKLIKSWLKIFGNWRKFI